VIAHVVLFRPRADLSTADRDALFESMRAAYRAIPQIQRFVVGRRIRTGFPYESLARDFPFFAMLEFATAADLDTYLAHPAHVQLGDQFYLTSDAAEAYDYSMSDVSEGLDTL
jgi:hypothetical protein